MDNTSQNLSESTFTHDEASLDGLIKRRWVFEVPTKCSGIYTLPFYYLSLSLLPNEMQDSHASVFINGVEYKGTVNINGSKSVTSDLSVKHKGTRSYLFEEGYMRFDLKVPYIPNSAQSVQFVIKMRGMELDFPSEFVIRLLRSARAIDPAKA